MLKLIKNLYVYSLLILGLMLIIWFILSIISGQIVFSDLEILWSTIIAALAWWFKILYEKWSAEKNSIAKLQRIYSENINTISILILIQSQLVDNVKNIKNGKFVRYINHISYLQNIEESVISSIKNIELLNIIFKNKISIDRYNAVLKMLWETYSNAIINDDLEIVQSKLDDFDETLLDFNNNGKDLLEELKLVQAHLYAAGNKIDASFLSKITRFMIYKYSSSEVETELNNIRNQINK